MMDRLPLKCFTHIKTKNRKCCQQGLKTEPFNSLPNNKFLDWSRLKAFADDKINVTKKLKFVFTKIEIIEGKGENACYQHFLFFPQCFLKPSFSRSLKVSTVW